MKHWAKWARWAWMLPVAELFLAAIIAGPYLFWEYRAARLLEEPETRNALRTLRLPDFSQPLPPPKHNWLQLVSESLPQRSQSVALLNIPGASIDLFVIAVRHRPTIAMTRTFPFDRWAWAAMLYPIFAIPFWWILGRSLDCRRTLKSETPAHLRWWDLALMLPLAIIGLAAWVSYVVTATPADKADINFIWVTTALGVWGVFAALATFIWFLQWKRRRLSPLAPA
jgi:hypothetical protein